MKSFREWLLEQDLNEAKVKDTFTYKEGNVTKTVVTNLDFIDDNIKRIAKNRGGMHYLIALKEKHFGAWKKTAQHKDHYLDSGESLNDWLDDLRKNKEYYIEYKKDKDLGTYKIDYYIK
jgi:hypothetical protein